MTVKEIVTEYLKANGYDGLCGFECGCLIGDGLMTCAEMEMGDQIPDCVPGYKAPCDPSTCPAFGECEWHVSAVKPETEGMT